MTFILFFNACRMLFYASHIFRRTNDEEKQVEIELVKIENLIRRLLNDISFV